MPAAPRNALAGLVADRKTGEVLWKADGVRPVPSTEALMEATLKRYGGAEADYVVGYLSDTTAYSRLKAGESNTITVAGDGAVSVDFTREADVVELRIAIAGGEFQPVRAVVNIAATAHLNGAPLETFSETVYVPMRTPSGVAFMRFDFVDGAASRTLTLSTHGEWGFPRHRNRTGTEWKIETAAAVKAHL